jgi:hypothetical protein
MTKRAPDRGARSAAEGRERSMGMQRTMRHRPLLVVCLCLLVCTEAHAQMDPLPSWNDGPAKQAILDLP